MSRTRAHTWATTLGWATPLDVPTVTLSLNGPKGGKSGSGELSPAAARQLAYDLLMAADDVETAGHSLNYRGYVITPSKDGQCCDWIHADTFDVGYPESVEPINQHTIACLSHAKAFVDEEILKCQN